MINKVVDVVRMHIIVAGLTAVMICSSMMIGAPAVKAASLEEMQTQMKSLMEQITALQTQIRAAGGNSSNGGAGGYGTSGAGEHSKGSTGSQHRPEGGEHASTTLQIGTKVMTTEPLRVRGAAGIKATFIATQPAGVEGTIVEGPVALDGYRWFKVDYATGADGWNVGVVLRSKTRNEAGDWMRPPRMGESSSTMGMWKPRASSTFDGVGKPRASSTEPMRQRSEGGDRKELNTRTASTSGSVLGASTDKYAEIAETLKEISTTLSTLQ